MNTVHTLHGARAVMPGFLHARQALHPLSCILSPWLFICFSFFCQGLSTHSGVGLHSEDSNISTVRQERVCMCVWRDSVVLGTVWGISSKILRPCELYALPVASVTLPSSFICNTWAVTAELFLGRGLVPGRRAEARLPPPFLSLSKDKGAHKFSQQQGLRIQRPGETRAVTPHRAGMTVSILET